MLYSLLALMTPPTGPRTAQNSLILIQPFRVAARDGISIALPFVSSLFHRMSYS